MVVAVENYLNSEEIAEEFGIPMRVVRTKIGLAQVYYRRGDVEKIVEEYRAKGWNPGKRRCAECGEWKDKSEFRPMDPCCKFCRAGIGGNRNAGC